MRFLVAVLLYACSVVSVEAKQVSPFYGVIGAGSLNSTEIGSSLRCGHLFEEQSSSVGFKYAPSLRAGLGYFVSDHVALETSIGLLPSLKAYDGLYGGGIKLNVGEASLFENQFNVKYSFDLKHSRIRPFAGLGISVGRTISSEASEVALPGLEAVIKRFDVDTSYITPVITGGVAYKINDRWFVDMIVDLKLQGMKVAIDDGKPDSNRISTNHFDATYLQIHPQISVGYRF